MYASERLYGWFVYFKIVVSVVNYVGKKNYKQMTHQGRMHLWAQEQSQTRRHFILFCFVHGTKYIYVYTSKPTKKITSISTSNMYFFDTMQCTFFFSSSFLLLWITVQKVTASGSSQIHFNLFYSILAFEWCAIHYSMR